MKVQGYHIFFIGALIIAAASGWYSFGRYTATVAEAHGEAQLVQKEIPQSMDIIPAVNLEALLTIRPYSRYDALEKRNIFEKFAPVKEVLPKAAVPVALPTVKSLPKKIQKPPEPPKEPVVTAPKTEYFYRGIMKLENGKQAHIIEQINPSKTYFLEEEERSGGLQILEVGKYGITIENRQGTVIELPIKKE